MDLSVMFFGADGAAEGGAARKYDDILTVVRLADELGFKAVWTPERHFQEFGQVFPAPAVLSAALAAATRTIEVRAGSVVLPLHHPLRTVEEWSVLDNLSKGRVGISVATGWHSADFVLAPDNYADRRTVAFDQIGLIRKLWAGEAAEFADGLGEPIQVRPRPEPFSPRLPMWLTSSGNPETWAAAGRFRTNVLAAAPGHTKDELAEKIRIYREAYASASEQVGAADQGIVTLMVHAYVDDSDAAVRSAVRVPLKKYFTSFTGQASTNKRDERGAATLTDAQKAAMAEFAMERYFAGGSLLGSPEKCHAALAEFADLGVDELACLVDFGLEHDAVVKSLHRLAELQH